MAKARMLHKSISTSSQVNGLSLPARLLFTWLIPHADDEGRLKGNPEYVKALVTPMTNWSFGKITQYLEEIKKAGLIFYWEQNSEWFIEFIKWKEHQSIKSDRFKPSDLPSYKSSNGDKMPPKSIQIDSKPSPQSNISELRLIKVNKSEFNEKIADNNSFKKIGQILDTSSYKPNSGVEEAAYEAFRKLEPSNAAAFKSTYVAAAVKGLPADKFYQFTSEIKQDSSINNPGAVFNAKVEEYFKSIGK